MGQARALKQGGIATQRADVVAEAIAAELGTCPDPAPLDPVLRPDRSGSRPAMTSQLSGRSLARRIERAREARSRIDGKKPRKAALGNPRSRWDICLDGVLKPLRRR